MIFRKSTLWHRKRRNPAPLEDGNSKSSFHQSSTDSGREGTTYILLSAELTADPESIPVHPPESPSQPGTGESMMLNTSLAFPLLIARLMRELRSSSL